MNATAISDLDAALNRGDEQLARKRLVEKIAVLEEFNRLLVESVGDCILIVDSGGQVLSINASGRELLQVPGDELPLRRHWATLFPDLDSKSAWGKLPKPNTRSTFQASSRTPAGETKFWNITFTSFDDTHANDRFLLIARDVTEHMMAERALRQSEQAFRKIFEENPIGMLIAGLDRRVSRANSAFSAMVGFLETELVGKDLRDWLFVQGPEESDLFSQLLQGEITSFQRELTLKTRRGQPVWTHITVSVLRDPENRPAALLHMVENIQDRKSAEEQVLAYQAQLQSLASEVALSEERERRRIATNLHDEIGQSLAFARLKLAAAAESNQTSLVTQLREIIDQAIAATRSLTFELSPPVLYELGLVAGVEWLARKIQQEHGIQTRFHDDGQPKPLDEKLRIVLFQGVRELLVNIAKHAHASHAQVLLRRDGDAIRIVIEDDGVGFDIGKLRSAREPRSFGLFNIRERIEYLGGRVKMSSEPSRGTRVTLIAPLKLDAPDPIHPSP